MNFRRGSRDPEPGTDRGAAGAQCPGSGIFVKKGNHPLILQYLERLAGIIAMEDNILNPDYVILGGGVPAMKGFPLEILLEQIRSHTRKPYPEQGLQIIVTEDGEKKGVTGAVLYAERHREQRKMDSEQKEEE